MWSSARRAQIGGALLLLAVSGCGYTLGYRVSEGTVRLAVPMFENQTLPLRREVEFDLTRAVRQQLELRSDVHLVSVANADAVLKGTVVSFRELVLAEGARDAIHESSIDVAVRVRLERLTDGQVLLDEMVTDSAPYSVLRGESLDDARPEAIDKIAQRIVAGIEAWD